MIYLVRFLGEGNGHPLQYSCLGNHMDGGAWWATVHGVAKSWTWLSDFIFTFHFHALEKEMATHSSILAWRIPGTEESGGLPSMGSQSWTQLMQLSSSSSSSKIFIFLNMLCIFFLSCLIIWKMLTIKYSSKKWITMWNKIKLYIE